MPRLQHISAIYRGPSTGKYRRKPKTTRALLLFSGHWPCETKAKASTTVHFRRIEENDMSVSEALATLVDDTVESSGLAPRNGFLEPRCRVCKNDALRRKVNDQLSVGASYAQIVRALGEDNAKLDKRDRVTVDSIRNHCGRHFPVQNFAKATYREILECRAKRTASNSSRA